MRIAVMGTGGVGGGFGAALAKAGADVTFIARGAHLTAMKSAGLRIEGGRGETHIVPTQATDDPTNIGPVDFVLFCVKLWDVETGKCFATFTCDSTAHCCAYSGAARLIVAGDAGGHLHFLRLEEPKRKF